MLSCFYSRSQDGKGLNDCLCIQSRNRSAQLRNNRGFFFSLLYDGHFQSISTVHRICKCIGIYSVFLLRNEPVQSCLLLWLYILCFSPHLHLFKIVWIIFEAVSELLSNATWIRNNLENWGWGGGHPRTYVSLPVGKRTHLGQLLFFETKVKEHLWVLASSDAQSPHFSISNSFGSWIYKQTCVILSLFSFFFYTIDIGARSFFNETIFIGLLRCCHQWLFDAYRQDRRRTPNDGIRAILAPSYLHIMHDLVIVQVPCIN